jgi:uracil-DNA glycosylase
MNRVMLLGQAPGPNTDPRRPLSGASGARLARLLGVDDLTAVFALGNLLGRFPGASPGQRGDAFPLARARRAAGRFRPAGDVGLVVFVGKNVARAFGRLDLDYFARDEHSFGRRVLEVTTIPHPSGISHWWNEPANVRRARRFLRALAEAA